MYITQKSNFDHSKLIQTNVANFKGNNNSYRGNQNNSNISSSK